MTLTGQREKIKPANLLLAVVGSIGLCLLSAHSVAAAPQKSITYNGVTVSPAIIKVNLRPNQANASFTITVSNNTIAPVDLTVSSVDFKSLNSSGGLAFIDSSGKQFGNKHGLASWLTIGSKNIHLEPKQSSLVPATVDNRADLSPGGHYAAVLFKGENANSNKGVTHVAVNQVVSSLIFVQKLGGERYGLSLEKPKLPTSWFNLPDHINLMFKNTGNIQETPFGLVTIKDPLGREISRGIIDTSSSLILPDSQRYFRTNLFDTARAWLPGKYTTTVKYHPDDPSAGGTISTQFWYLNLKFLAIAILFIVLLGIVVAKTTNLLRSRRSNKKA